VLRYLGLVFTIGVSAGVQVLMVWALFHHADGDPGWPYGVEALGAAIWTIWLIRVARSPRA
jgi:ABC-type cobalamin transport system permease subunit